MADYISKYSGAEIDEAVRKALSGGSGTVKSVNGIEPDDDGNITIASATVEDVLAALPRWTGGAY